MTFGQRLRTAMTARGPLCAGIDPHPALMDQWGLTDSAFGLEKFAMTAVEALGDTVAAIKPQSAFFERHGSQGIAVLEQVVRHARDLGALVILDG
jgi:orotidine-5'-phosphate decarboxylase